MLILLGKWSGRCTGTRGYAHSPLQQMSCELLPASKIVLDQLSIYWRRAWPDWMYKWFYMRWISNIPDWTMANDSIYWMEKKKKHKIELAKIETNETMANGILVITRDCNPNYDSNSFWIFCTNFHFFFFSKGYATNFGIRVFRIHFRIMRYSTVGGRGRGGRGLTW